MINFSVDQDYLRDFFEYAPIGFHAFGADRIIIDVNQAELDMLGYTKDEIVGKKTWADLIIPSEIPLFQQHWKMINLKGEVRNLNYTLLRKDGCRRKVLLSASARFDASGKLLNTRGSVIDITEFEQKDRALKISKMKISRQKSALENNNMILLNSLDQRDYERRELQKNIQKNVEETILPLIEKLKRRGSQSERRHMSLLQKHVLDLTSDFALKLMDGKWRLSIREIEICKMLKSGFKTKEIADLLCISNRTIEHHRNHIRKKLKISDPNTDLGEYLRNFSM